MPDFRRGADAVAQSQQKAKSGGSFTPFAPELFWKGDGDEKYLLFLNPMVDIPTVDMISFIPQKRKKADGESYTVYERVIARTDPAIGEDVDPMTEKWEGQPKDTCVAVAVELEPTLEEVGKRMRPTGFEIKTNTYERRIRDDDGELTDDTEEVIAPAVGFIHASPHNFFNVITAFDSKEGDIEATPVKITRVGSGTSTTYSITGYPDQVIDLTPLLDYTDGISYLTSEEQDALLKEIDGISDEDAALVVGATLLDKRLEELSDSDRHERLFKSITESLDKFGGKKKGKKAEPKKVTRPTRASSRRKPAEAESESVPEPEVEEKPARRSRAAATPSQKDPEKMSKLDKLRQRNEEHKATA